MSWVRVLAYPGRHPYVDRLHGRVAQLVHRDETGQDGRAHDPDWILDHGHEVELVHLHVGLVPVPDWSNPEARPVAASDLERTRAVVQAWRQIEVPIVVTVHELDGLAVGLPRDALRDLVRALSPHTSAVVTLTRACAQELEAMLDRPVRVIPYGPLLDQSTRERLRAHRRRMATANRPLLLPILDPAQHFWQDAVAALDQTQIRRRLRIDVPQRHQQVIREAIGRRPDVSVITYDDLAEHRLPRAVADAVAVVLPYRHVTHCGLLELATDIGTPVIASDIGQLCEQQPLITVPSTDDGLDVGALASAYDCLVTAPPAVRDVDRERDQMAFEAHHGRLYRLSQMARLFHETLLDRPDPLVANPVVDQALDLRQDSRTG